MIAEKSIETNCSSTADAIKKSNMLKLAEYQKTLFINPKLEILFFELTDSCNLNCRHCGSRCSASNKMYLDREVIEGVINSVAERYAPQKIMINLTGGEPLLHKDCIGIIKYARMKGFPVGMTSNGTLIDMAMARELKKAGLDTISISLDGIGSSHDELRMVSGSFDRAVNGIRALKSVDIEPQITTVVHKDNIDELDKIYNFAIENDIYSWRLTNVDPIGRALDARNMLLNYGELIRLFDYIKEKRFDKNNSMEVTYGCSHFVSFDYERMIRKFYFQCGAGTKSASIMVNGDIGACLDIERRKDLVQGNAYKDDFIDAWENRFKIFRQDRTRLSKNCSECSYSNVCMGDSAHTWDCNENEPMYCITVNK